MGAKKAPLTPISCQLGQRRTRWLQTCNLQQHITARDGFMRNPRLRHAGRTGSKWVAHQVRPA